MLIPAVYNFSRPIPGGIAEPPRDREDDLVRQWQDLPPGTILKTTQGKSVLVVDPGRRNRHDGPDLQEAVLLIAGSLRTGEVECHLEAGGWIRHGHGSDPRYRQVILHVVRQAPQGPPAGLLPTVILPVPPAGATAACRLVSAHPARNLEFRVMAYAGLRWQRKVQEFARQPDSEVHLLRAVLDILGQPGNRVAFGRLARRLDPVHLKALDYNGVLNSLQVETRRLGLRWNRGGVRPHSRAEKRLELAARVIGFITGRDPVRWATLAGFQEEFRQGVRIHSGEGIRVELLGNVFYPYLGARFLAAGDLVRYTGIRRQWQALRLPYTYQRYQRQFGYILPPTRLRSFAVLQGLITIRREFCDRHHCQVCPLTDQHGHSDAV